MYITINGIKGEKRIDLSYSIQNFDSSKEIAVIRMLSDNVQYHRQIPVNKSDTTWNWSFNTPCKSLKGFLVLFEEEKLYA